MHKLKRLIGEIHRRSLWQVLGIYVFGSWVVLQVVDLLAENMGLPPWTFPFALVLLLIGLPIVLATAFVQEGLPARKDDETAAPTAAQPPSKQLFNWRNAVVGGVVAFVLFGMVAAGWMVFAPRVIASDSKASIAVLPFASTQTDEQSQAFVTGIHDDLLTQLSKIDSLTVISRTSVMKYKDAGGKSVPQIGRELGVTTVLEGGVQRAGERLRLNVQLIEVETDKHLWAETYDEELTAANIFDIQSDLARKIAAALRTRLSPETRERIAERPTESLEAYDLVARGRFIMNDRGSKRDGIESAAKLFQQAIAADPSYAPAHVALAQTYLALHNGGYMAERDAFPKLRAGIEQALKLDPKLAEAEALRGTLLRLEGRFDDAETALRRALELNPGLARARTAYAGLLIDLGRPEDALREARRGVELDPLSGGARRNLLSRLVWARQYDQAVAEAEKLRELNPEDADGPYYAAMAWSMKGEHERAIAEARRAIEMNPEDPYYPAFLAFAYARAGKRPEAMQALQQAEKLKAPLKEIALVYGQLGDLDRAFDYLERGLRDEPASVRSTFADPTADALRADPRWKALVAKFRVN